MIRYIETSQINQRFHNALPLTGIGGPYRATGGARLLGLGASGALGLAPIPWSSCWDPPGGTGKGGFNTCHDQAVRDAQSQCGSYNPNVYDSFDDCVTQTKDVLVSSRCLKFCASTAAVYRGGDPCNSGSAILYAQKKLGVKQDGDWGPLSQGALVKSGTSFQGLIGCTGSCPGAVGDPCSGMHCLEGFEMDPATGGCVLIGCPQPQVLVGGHCVTPSQPAPGCPIGEHMVDGQCTPECAGVDGPCPCCEGFECGSDGICRAPPPPSEKSKSSMMWMGLLGAGLVGAYLLMSQKGKKRRPNRPRRPNRRRSQAYA